MALTKSLLTMFMSQWTDFYPTAADTTGRPPEEDYDKDVTFIPCSILSGILFCISQHGIKGAEDLYKSLKKQPKNVFA